MGETVVLGWLTLELTNSPFMVGVAMGTRMLPLFFVGVPAGALADRLSRRRLLMLSGSGQALTAATLGAFALTGRVTLAHVLVLTLAAGLLRAIEHAARQGYTHDIVGPTALVHGLASAPSSRTSAPAPPTSRWPSASSAGRWRSCRRRRRRRPATQA